MGNLIKFFINYHNVLLFLSLELFALFLSVKHSNIKTKAFITSANVVSGFVNENINLVTDYLKLKAENEKLVNENIKLHSKISEFDLSLKDVPQKIKKSDFTYISAEVIKNSIFRRTNFLTINKGKNDSVQPDMAVISPEGVVGITSKVSQNFTTVISVLNNKLKISGKLKNSNYFGSISWNGDDYRYVFLDDIPNHAEVKRGDTVVTSGYSSIFPKGISIGVVEKISDIKERNFFRIQVDLFTDFKNLGYVYVIKNHSKKEIKKLETETENIFEF